MIKDYLRAGYPALWMQSYEYERASAALAAEAQETHGVMLWDIVSGCRTAAGQKVAADGTDPLSAIQMLERAQEETVMVAMDFHKFIASVEVWRALANALADFKAQGKCFIVLSPVPNVPAEVEKYFTLLDFRLPDVAELQAVLETVCHDNEIAVPEDLDEVLRAGLGLTAFEFENAVALSVVRHGQIVAEPIRGQKAQLVRKNGSLEFSRFQGGFETLAGLTNLKQFAAKMAVNCGRGVLLLGVPGTGKSHFAKCLGNEVGRPTVSLDFGTLMGSLVGETEGKTKAALEIVDAMAPCVLFVDEIEKGLSGMASSHLTDGGTGARQGSLFLKWLNDHGSDVFVVATSNDIQKIPPEFLRSERWDAVFFVDLPSSQEREAIFALYCQQFGLDPAQPQPSLEGWTGAEIKTLCRLAAKLEASLLEAAEFVTPLSLTMGEKIEALRQWAQGRTIPASKIETAPEVSTAASRGRKISLNQN